MRKRLWLLLIPGLVLVAYSSFSCVFPTTAGVSQACAAGGMVDVTFHWLPSSTRGDQYLDVSWYSTFPAGNFLSVGPIDPNAGATAVPGLTANRVHHWRVNSLKDGIWYTSQIGSFITADCGTGDGSAIPTGLRLVIPKIGVNASINARVVGGDGQMGTPNGKDDVIWYDFSNFGGVGGFPGVPGANALLSGHVDYHPHYTAVFWDLRQLVQGDEIWVQLLDGSWVKYWVEWTMWIDDQENFGQFATRDGIDKLTIVTCGGTFDSATRNYSNRFVVRAQKWVQ